jgi:hypothetical protein
MILNVYVSILMVCYENAVQKHAVEVSANRLNFLVYVNMLLVTHAWILYF